VRTLFLARRPAKVLFTTDCSTAQPAKAALSVGQHERISNWHQVTRWAAATQGVVVIALQQLSEQPSGGGQSDTNAQAFSACNLMRLPLRRRARLWTQLWHLLSQAALLHPMSRKRKRRGVDVARPPRSSTGYCGVGHLAALLAGCQSQWQSPDEPAVHRTVHNSKERCNTNWLCTLFLHRNRDNGHGQGLLVLVYAYMHSLFNELAWRLTYDYMV